MFCRRRSPFPASDLERVLSWLYSCRPEAELVDRIIGLGRVRECHFIVHQNWTVATKQVGRSGQVRIRSSSHCLICFTSQQPRVVTHDAWKRTGSSREIVGDQVSCPVPSRRALLATFLHAFHSRFDKLNSPNAACNVRWQRPSPACKSSCSFAMLSYSSRLVWTY
jgi:hypothetical protein